MQTPKPDLDTRDIQGILVRAYSYLDEACYIMIRFNDEAKGRDWISSNIMRITTGKQKPKDLALQIAFTNCGIFKFLPQEKFQECFSREFTEGMTQEVRSRVLGDVESNGPSKWYWGRESNEIDAVLMLFAINKDLLDRELQRLDSEFETFNIKKIIRLDTSRVPGNKEHFGFRDGISQPRIKGLEKTEDQKIAASKKRTSGKSDKDSIMPGEFILGYLNEYNIIPFSPLLKAPNKSLQDFGKNGSYMVFRQLEQDVKRFWEFVNETVTGNPHFKGDNDISLASKMVGRWPNGNPLTVDNPDEPPTEELNDFLYKKGDKDGFRCPIGSHARKSNPRDGIDTDPITSLQVARRHRILRRGRSYGPPLSPAMTPQKMREAPDHHKRGLYFICFNANIGRQFEFIQHTWDNNPKFDGLYKDIDPIIGFPYTEGQYTPGEFTIPGQPVRKKVFNIPQFVFVKGGAYFFMPAITSLKIISGQPS
jgi:Dyp-type peroxidase family